MKLELSASQRKFQQATRAFADAEIAPYAAQFDEQEQIPLTTIRRLAEQRYLGAVLPTSRRGLALDMITFGLLNEELGRTCSSVRSLLTVHSMVAFTINRWGTEAQKRQWLPALATGEMIGAFALSEPEVGSDAQGIQSQARLEERHYVLNGQKKWITFGQIADLFLIFARLKNQPAAFLVERHTPGLTTKPITGMLGTRASMLAEVYLDECRVPEEALIGRPGFGFQAIVTSALDMGRYSVAWGCVGIGQACLEACLRYASQRRQFGVYLKEHQLVRQMLTNMITDVKAARLLCYQAGYLKDIGDLSAPTETMIAKYFASTMATRVANDAVQLHGANGCSREYPVQRYLRDARIMEIIEGSTQIQQNTIALNGYQTPTLIEF